LILHKINPGNSKISFTTKSVGWRF